MENADEKYCPFCYETIKAKAIKCRFCGEFLDGKSPQRVPDPAQFAPDSMISNQYDGNEAEEEFIYNGPMSRIALVGPAIAFLVWISLAVALGGFGTQVVARAGPDVAHLKHFPAVAGLGIGVIATFWFAFKWIIFHCRIFRITRDRIEYEEGIFSKRVENMDMWRVEDVRFHRGIIQAMFGVGYIFIESSDASDPTIVIGPLPDARRLFYVTVKNKLQILYGSKDEKKNNFIIIPNWCFSFSPFPSSPTMATGWA